MATNRPTRGQIYWFRRGKTQRALGLIVARGPTGWLEVRIFYERSTRWADPALLPPGAALAAADDAEYKLRRALQFADVALTNVLLSPAPKNERPTRARTNRTKPRAA